MAPLQFEALLQRLQANDESMTELNFDPAALDFKMCGASFSQNDLYTLTDIMNQNTVVDTVKINLDFIANERFGFMLFRAIGFLHQLDTLEIFSTSLQDLNISLLTMLLDSTVSLTSLSLSNIKLIGSKKELDRHQNVLQRKCQTTLRKLKIFETTPFHKHFGWDQQIKILSVCNSKINEIRIFRGGSKAVRYPGKSIQSLFKILTLKVLSLNGLQLSKNELYGITNALKADFPLQYLNLSFNNLGDHGGISIMNSLLKNKYLQELYVANNNLGYGSAAATAGLLKCNSTLKCLSLSCNNNITEKGCIDIGQALFSNNSIRKLYLRNCGLGNLSTSVIANALHHNVTLRELYLKYDNEINDGVWLNLVMALEHNNALEEIKIESPVPSHILSEIKYYCDLNKLGLRSILQKDKNHIRSRKNGFFTSSYYAKNKTTRTIVEEQKEMSVKMKKMLL